MTEIPRDDTPTEPLRLTDESGAPPPLADDSSVSSPAPDESATGSAQPVFEDMSAHEQSTADDVTASNYAGEADVKPPVDANPPDPANDAPTSSTPRRSLPLALAALALLISLATLIGGYLWWRDSSASNTAQARQLSEQLAQTQSRLNDLQASVSGVESSSQKMRDELGAGINDRLRTLQDSQQQLQIGQRDMRDTVQALNAEVRKKTGTSAALAESEYLIRTASNHLLFDRDVTTAIAALNAADQRLRATGDPDVIRVRALLADDINALASLKPADIEGLALNLSSLIGTADTLPLPPGSPGSLPASQGQAFSLENWRATAGNLWSEIKSLIVVHHDDIATQPLLPPDQTYFLYQNLRLELEAARLAVLRRDPENFHISLDTASKWIKASFDTQAASTRHLLDSLARFSGIDINPPLPEISASLKAVTALLDDKTILDEQAAPTATPPTSIPASIPDSGNSSPATGNPAPDAPAASSGPAASNSAAPDAGGTSQP